MAIKTAWCQGADQHGVQDPGSGLAKGLHFVSIQTYGAALATFS